MPDPWRATAAAAGPDQTPRRRARRARDQQRRLALVVTTDLGVPDEPAPTPLVGRWNVLDRGVRPLVVRSDGTFTLVDHPDGRTDGRWLRVSDTFVSLFVDGPKRHSLYSMPDGQVFLSRYALPGTTSTPELLFRSVLSFEGTWETPYRASSRSPAPLTRVSLGADRTFCADLGHSGDDGSVVVWSGLWARTSDTTATLDYVAWSVADRTRRMASHGQTTLELREDGTLVVAALDDVLYPAPGTVRAEGEAPLATAEEPAVLVGALAVVEDPPPDPDETAGPAAPSPDVEAPSAPEDPAAPDVEDALLRAGAAPARRRRRARRLLFARSEAQRLASQRDAVGTVELPSVDRVGAEGLAVQRDAVATVELPSADRVGAEGLAVQRDAVATVELPSADPRDDATAEDAAVPVARTTADDGTPVVVVLYADENDRLRVGAVPASQAAPGVRTETSGTS